MDDDKKKTIDAEVFKWMKENEPTSLEQDRPPWGCVLHAGRMLGVEIDEGRESAMIAREVYISWMKYRVGRDPVYAEEYKKKLGRFP